MKNLHAKLVRYATIVAVLAVGAVTLLPALEQTVFAGGQVTSRFIQLSDSTPGGTSVTYNVSFKPTVGSNIGGIVVDFCADSPTVGNTSCTFPTGFTLGTSASVSGLSGFSTSTGSWTTANSLQCGAAASNKQVLIYTNATPQTPTGTSTAINFQITGVTNTSTVGTFYARIVTFDTDAHATSNYTCPTGTTRGNTLTGEIDYGGVALSTANYIAITAYVQEALTFCVSGTSVADCTSPTSPAFTIGHAVGSQTVLDSSAVDNKHAYTVTATNAQSGVVVRMKNTNASATCGGLSSDGGTTCGIPAAGASAITINAGTANIGMCVTAGTANTTAASPYDSASCTQYGLDQSTSNNNVLSTYGSQIFSSSGTLNNETDDLKFVATAATTTKPGIYTANYALIATGTF